MIKIPPQKLLVLLSLGMALIIAPLAAAETEETLAPGGNVIISSSPTAQCVRLKEVEQIIFTQCNQKRQAENLPAFLKEDVLQSLAGAYSQDMLLHGFFSHVDPAGRNPSDRVALGHRTLVGIVGENIGLTNGYDASDSKTIAAIIIDGWMKSPTHRANILRPEFTHLGVGVYALGPEVRAVQNFAGVKTYLKKSLPAKIVKGAQISLASQPLAPVKYDFILPGKDSAAAGPWPLGADQTATISAAPGKYRLRCYFSAAEKNKLTIFFGPQVEISE